MDVELVEDEDVCEPEPVERAVDPIREPIDPGAEDLVAVVVVVGQVRRRFTGCVIEVDSRLVEVFGRALLVVLCHAAYHLRIQHSATESGVKPSAR